ncbi:MAG: hypothetical protein ACI8XO_001520 [Verrucomicrobiales bacterium]|jgi:hypothetical protein
MQSKPSPTPSCSQILRLGATLLLAVLATSCEDSEHFFLLNPDGSGRVTAKEKILASNFGIRDQVTLTEAAVGTLAELVARSEGIDAWEKVTYTTTKSGDFIVEATGLFPDVSKLKLATTAMAPTLADGLKFEKGSKDSPATLELLSPIVGAGPHKIPADAKTDDQSIAAELEKTRNMWLGAEKDIRPEYGKKSAKITFHLSGEIKSHSNFTKEAKNQVTLEVTAPKVLDTLEKVIEDDDLATEILKTGAEILSPNGAPPIKPETFNKLTFGEAKPIRIEFTPGPMLFDYGSAVDNAKANQSALLKQVEQMALRSKQK